MKNTDYQALAHKYIPGGAHTYSRGDDQFPSNAPPVLARGKGAYVWDAEGNKFLDYGMGLRSVGIGYANEAITQAAIAEIEKGNNLTRASVTEILAAEKLCTIIPSAEMVKFAKHGSAVTSAATKLARAITSRQMILRCAQHPFFSYDDWFIGDTVINNGVPEQIRELTKNFNYNDVNSIELMFTKYPDQFSCVIMEAATNVHPVDSKYFPNQGKNFLHDVQYLCEKNGSLFIIDEMITGLRWDIKGASHYYGINPDLVTFGKAIANGFSVAALAGKRVHLERGGLGHDKERIFLTSTTHGAEMCGMGALIASLDFYEKNNVTKHIWNYGEKLTTECNSLAKSYGIADYFKIDGIACSPTYSTYNKMKETCMGMRTLLNQEMIKNNIIFNYLSPSYSHGDEELNLTLKALESVLKIYSLALEDGYEKYLKGHVVKPVFRKFN